MARLSMSLFGVFVTVVALGMPPQGAGAALAPPRDSAVGGGEAGIFHEIFMTANSDSLGGDTGGTVSFVAEIVVGGNVARVRFAGPVTCLGVEGNRAVIGFLGPIGPMKVLAVDNGATGSPADGFGVSVLATDCSNETGVGTHPLSTGDIAVRDVPSKAQCLAGGWRSYSDAAGQPFRNQGECIAFALGAS